MVGIGGVVTGRDPDLDRRVSKLQASLDKPAPVSAGRPVCSKCDKRLQRSDVYAHRWACNECAIKFGMAEPGPAQNLDHLPWRDERPDAEGFWFVRSGNRYWLEWTGPGPWPEGWQCCPVTQ